MFGNKKKYEQVVLSSDSDDERDDCVHNKITNKINKTTKVQSATDEFFENIKTIDEIDLLILDLETKIKNLDQTKKSNMQDLAIYTLQLIELKARCDVVKNIYITELFKT